MMDGRSARGAIEGELRQHIRGCREGPERCIACREVEWLRSKDAVRPSWGEQLRRVLEGLTWEEGARLARLHARIHPDCHLRLVNKGVFIQHIRYAHRGWNIKIAQKQGRCRLCEHDLEKGDSILLLGGKRMERLDGGRFAGWIHVQRCPTCEREGARIC